MKIKIIVCIVLFAALLAIAACAAQPEPEYIPTNGDTSPTGPSYDATTSDNIPVENSEQETESYTLSSQAGMPGKIAIIAYEHNTALGPNHGENWVIELKEIHGHENIIIYTHPISRSFRAAEVEAMIDEIAQNPEIRMLIINPARSGADHIAGMLRQQRDDIFIVYIGYEITVYSENPFQDNALSHAASNANLILNINTNEMARRVPANALELGADTLIFFYDSVTWDDEEFVESFIHSMMRDKSAEIGLMFVEIDIEGYIQCGSSFHMFLERMIPLLIEEYGTNIVLYGLDNWRVLGEWLREGLFFLPMSTNLLELCPASLALELQLIDWSAHIRLYDIPRLIDEIRRYIEERGLQGRIAVPPMSPRMLFPLAAVEYGIMWMQGGVQIEGIDIQVMEQIMADLIVMHTGLNKNITLSPLEENGVIYENYMLILADLLIY